MIGIRMLNFWSMQRQEEENATLSLACTHISERGEWAESYVCRPEDEQESQYARRSSRRQCRMDCVTFR